MKKIKARMIYYTNTNLFKPHMTFIGRWSPFHMGHVSIINKKRSEHPHLPVLIMVRNSKNEQYTAIVRAEYIKIWMLENNIQGTIMIVPNIEGVYWGRDVGYRVGKVDVDKATEHLSATNIRNEISSKTNKWLNSVANKHASPMLTPKISVIIQNGLVVWLTGCPSSGKTTIATALHAKLSELYPFLKTQILDGDDMRTSPLAAHIGFTQKDRADHIRRMAYIANMFAKHGILIICAFVSPDKKIREKVKRHIGKDRFIEVYVSAHKKTRIQRDPKGLYKKAQSGKLTNLTGFDGPYEQPDSPDVLCKTDNEKVEQSVQKIIDRIVK